MIGEHSTGTAITEMVLPTPKQAMDLQGKWDDRISFTVKMRYGDKILSILPHVNEAGPYMVAYIHTESLSPEIDVTFEWIETDQYIIKDACHGHYHGSAVFRETHTIDEGMEEEHIAHEDKVYHLFQWPR